MQRGKIDTRERVSIEIFSRGETLNVVFMQIKFGNSMEIQANCFFLITKVYKKFSIVNYKITFAYFTIILSLWFIKFLSGMIRDLKYLLNFSTY